MKQILVATDFSSTAANAAEYAADMAMAINAELFLLHAYQLPVIYTEIPVAALDEDITAQAETSMRELKEKLSQRTNSQVVIRTEVRTGFFFQELNAVCDRVKPYTVIMGSQGKTAAERLLFGGHTVYAMKHLEWPLITVPPKVRFSSIKKIGLACDFADVVATTPVDEIKKLVHDFNAELHILNTGKQSEFEPQVIFESALMQEMLGSLKPEYHFITNRNIDEGILRFSEENHIDLLIVLPKRHDFIERLLHKSHTRQFVLHSHVPVMALHE
jgi:nucleotide-binding universal stress UspA family protein